jgi:hypothetical protein
LTEEWHFTVRERAPLSANDLSLREPFWKKLIRRDYVRVKRQPAFSNHRS